MKEYYCPNCQNKLPTEINIVTTSMHILNKCFFCGAELWDIKGRFKGRTLNNRLHQPSAMKA